MSDLGVEFNLEASIGQIDKRLARMEASWIQRASDISRNVIVRFSGVIPSPTVATTLVGVETSGSGPQAGEVWVLRACRIGGVTPSTTAAGRGDLFMSPSDPTALGGTPSLASWLDQATSLPLVAFYGDQQIVIRAPDNFFVVVTNGTAGQQYLANAFFEVYRDGTYRQQINL